MTEHSPTMHPLLDALTQSNPRAARIVSYAQPRNDPEGIVPVWTADEFKSLADHMRTGVGSGSIDLAEAMGINPRTIQRIISGRNAPGEFVCQQAERVAEATGWEPPARMFYRADEWILGKGRKFGKARRSYLFHLHPPRFRARIIRYPNSPALHEIEWHDAEPGGEERVKLMHAALAAADRLHKGD